jgi:ABC-type Zn uptake system ZnuABC Zn-binding protein ZnuA
VLRTLVLALALAAAPGQVLAQQKLRVVATAADLKSLAKAVGGARVDVESLAAPEQDPHAIELKPAQLARVRSGALLIRVGLVHEPWLA